MGGEHLAVAEDSKERPPRRAAEDARGARAPREEEAERRDEEKERRWGPGWRKETGAGKDAEAEVVEGTRRDIIDCWGCRRREARRRREEIKSAYRKVAMEWHPDKHQGAAAKERAAKTFRELQRAYQVLGNRQEREVYDEM